MNHDPGFHLSCDEHLSKGWGPPLWAFNPYLFDHLSHLQVLTAAGIPLAFFFLHKYFESGSIRHLLLFSLSFVMQALANGYYAVFLTYFAGLFILDRAVRLRWLFKPWFWGHTALHAVVAIGLLAPFYYQYVWLRVNVGFVRNNVYRGTMWSFMSTSQWNNLYGELTSELSGAEWHLFPGLAVLGLGVLGVLAAMQRQGPRRSLGLTTQRARLPASPGPSTVLPVGRSSLACSWSPSSPTPVESTSRSGRYRFVRIRSRDRF